MLWTFLACLLFCLPPAGAGSPIKSASFFFRASNLATSSVTTAFSAFLALSFSGNQSSRYHIIMMIKKRKYNGTIHLVISKYCLWCCITKKPGDNKIFNTRTYTYRGYVNALMFSKNNLFGPVIRFIRFFLIYWH